MPFRPDNIEVFDIENDGDLDFAVSAFFQYNVSYFENLGNGNFERRSSSSFGLEPGAMAIADLDGDSFLDLAVCNTESGSVAVFADNCFLLGDVNLDGEVNLLDVNGFIDRIVTGTYQREADINQDGLVNLLDVAAMITLLTGG